MSNNDKSLFYEQFGDIQRIVSDNVEHTQAKPPPKPRVKPNPHETPQHRFIIPPSSPVAEPDSYSFQRNGIQSKLFNRLKRGQIKPQDTLDLHGLTGQEARQIVGQFITQCQDRGIQCALIIHGKGHQSKGPAILKPLTAQLLKDTPSVMAYHLAKPRDGGAGALYVLLKKSKKT